MRLINETRRFYMRHEAAQFFPLEAHLDPTHVGAQPRRRTRSHLDDGVLPRLDPAPLSLVRHDGLARLSLRLAQSARHARGALRRPQSAQQPREWR